MNNLCKKVIAAALAVTMIASGLVITKNQTSDVKAADTWNLVWSDEFNGTSLDTSVWSYEIGNGSWGWGNGEVEYYTNRTDNVKVADDCLQIIAKKENYGGQQYTSGRIISKGKKYFKYGKMEAKIKVENGNQDGVWPAYWMMGENMSQGVGWPNCGEIDIMEHANSNNYIGGCLHWNTKGINAPWADENHGSYGSGFPGAENAFGYFTDNENNGINGWHTYTLIWDESHMEWQLDGKTYLSQNITSNNAYCFQKEQFFLFNLAIGGTGTGFTNHITANPNTFKTTTMYVDYLRVYQKDSSGTGTSTAQPETKYDGPTKVTYEEVDAVANSKGVCESYFGGLKGWGDATGSISNATNTGFDMHIDSLGDNLWQVQGSLKDLEYIAGNTYTYKCTITSDVTKSVRVKVVGDSDDYIFSQEDITVKAGEPYYYEKQVTIPADYTGRLDLFFGLGKNHFVGENISSATAVNIKVSDMSFKTQKKVVTRLPVETSKNTEVTTPSKDGSTTVTSPARTKVKKATKQYASKKVKLTLKKIKGATGYKVQFSKTKKFKKVLVTKTVKKTKVTIKNKKLKNKKKLYVRAKAYKKVGNKKYYSKKWSVVKKVKIKK